MLYIGVARGPAIAGPVFIYSTILYRRVRFWPETFQSRATPMLFNYLKYFDKFYLNFGRNPYLSDLIAINDLILFVF